MLATVWAAPKTSTVPPLIFTILYLGPLLESKPVDAIILLFGTTNNTRKTIPKAKTQIDYDTLLNPAYNKCLMKLLLH